MTLQNQAMINAGSNPIWTEETLNEYYELGADNVYRYDTNWRDMVMKKTMLTHNHSVSITGGNKSVRSFVNASYNYEDGIIAHNDYNRMALRTNTDATITSWLRAGLNINLRRTNSSEPVTGSNAIIGYALTFSPVYGAVNADGTWANGQSGINPLAMAEVGGTTKYDHNDVEVKGTLVDNPLEGLDIVASYESRRYE